MLTALPSLLLQDLKSFVRILGGCSATPRSREGVVWVFQTVPHCPHFFSPNLEMSPQEAGRDPKLRSDLVEGMG